MKLHEALSILDEEGLILERKSVKEMTPEEYQADLEKRRERRKLRRERKAGSSSSSESNEELRKKNSEAIANGYREAERKINAELNEISDQFNRYAMEYNRDRSKARSSLKELINLKNELVSSNLLADIGTSSKASQLLDEIQRKVFEIRMNIIGNSKPRYMNEFRYLEVTFNRTPTTDGRPMDEWGKPFRIYVWDLPSRFDPRDQKVSKSEFTKWLKRLKCKYLKKFKSGTRRNRITWDSYDVYSTVYEIVSKDGWTYKTNVYFEAYEKEHIVIQSIRTNTGERLL